MTDLEKIQNLLNARTAENNYIAMCLMLEILGLSFEEAFLKLKIDRVFSYSTAFEFCIGDFQIYYHTGDIFDPCGWVCQRRENGQFMENIVLMEPDGIAVTKQFDKSLEGKSLEECPEFLDDIKRIAPEIKKIIFDN